MAHMDVLFWIKLVFKVNHAARLEKSSIHLLISIFKIYEFFWATFFLNKIFLWNWE